MVKKIVIGWSMKKLKQTDIIVKIIEQQIEDILIGNELDRLTGEQLQKIAFLEETKNVILRDREAELRIKIRSRAIWLELGDENNSYFHKFANQRSNILFGH